MVQVALLKRTLASSPQSKCGSCRQQGHVGSKTVLEQNPPVLNWKCHLMQVILYNGRKMVIVVVVASAAGALTACAACCCCSSSLYATATTSVLWPCIWSLTVFIFAPSTVSVCSW